MLAVVSGSVVEKRVVSVVVAASRPKSVPQFGTDTNKKMIIYLRVQ